MDFFEMVSHRHSVRRFDGRQVPEEYIAKILRAALSAPSSKNTRSSSFMVVDDHELLSSISEMRDFGSAFLKDVPLGIVVMGDETVTDLWVDNAAISATYIQLGAQALGLGSCWVHVNGRPRKKDDPDAGLAEDYLKTFLPVPKGRRILCVTAIGYPSMDSHSKRGEPDVGALVVRL